MAKVIDTLENVKFNGVWLYLPHFVCIKLKHMFLYLPLTPLSIYL